RGGGAGLAQEARAVARRGVFLVGELDGDATAQVGIFSDVDHSHAALAQLAQDAVMGYRAANHVGNSHCRARWRVIANGLPRWRRPSGLLCPDSSGHSSGRTVDLAKARTKAGVTASHLGMR